MGKKFDKAVRVTKKIAKGTKEVLNALPTVNTEAIEHDYSGSPFKNEPEHFYSPSGAVMSCRKKKKKKHNIANVSKNYMDQLM